MPSSNDLPRLPVIDLSLFDAGDPWRDHVAAQVDWAALEFGSFYIVGHGIEPALIDSVLARARSFFEQDSMTKRRVHMRLSGRAWRGYFPVGAKLTSGQPDMKEGLYFGQELADSEAHVRGGTPLHARNIFPELPDFRDAVLDYTRALTGLGHKLMTSIGRGLRLGDNYFVDRYTGDPTTLFRIFNHLPDAAAEEGTRGVAESTDEGLLTLLYQDDVGGLQVAYGSSWIDVPPVPGSFVVSTGDILERLTTGRYVSARQRVVNRSARARIAMPFFFDPSFEAMLQPTGAVGTSLIRRDPMEQRGGIGRGNVRGANGEHLITSASNILSDPGRRDWARAARR